YSAGITVLSTAEGRPARERRARLVACAAASVVFGGAGCLAIAGADGLAFGAFPAFAIVASAAFGRVPRRRRLASRDDGQRVVVTVPVKGQVLEMLLGF